MYSHRRPDRQSEIDAMSSAVCIGGLKKKKIQASENIASAGFKQEINVNIMAWIVHVL